MIHASVNWEESLDGRFATFTSRKKCNKKADVIDRPKAINHVGLLSNRPPGEPECHLFSRPTTCNYY